MKAKFSLLMVLLLSLAMVLAVGCTKARSDAQLASDAQSKIGADQSISSKQQLSVQAANGVVTLSGVVVSDAERNAAANDAASVEGVRTVVNNLTVQPPVVAQAQPPVQEQSAPAPVPEPQRRTTPRHSSRGAVVSQGGQAPPADNQTIAATPPAPSMPAQPAVPTAPATPPPPPPPTKLTIPSGTAISVRLNDNLDSERNKTGDTFRATLNAPIMVDNSIAIPADAEVQGHVVDVQSAGRFAGAARLAITLDRISYGGHSYQIQTDQWKRQSTGRGKSTAAKVGGGGALGAIIGGLAGGGKGAAIGATVGAGAGGGVQAATKGQQIKLSPEALVRFQTQSPLTVSVVAGDNRRALQSQ
jgi:hypothetical protein